MKSSTLKIGICLKVIVLNPRLMGLCSFGDCNGDIGFLFFVYGKISLTMDTQSVDINMEINGCFIRMFFIVIFTLY